MMKIIVIEVWPNNRENILKWREDNCSMSATSPRSWHDQNATSRVFVARSNKRPFINYERRE